MTAGLDDPEGLSGFWQWYDEMTPALRAQVIGPVLARLRSFLLRDFVKQSMGHPQSIFDMATGPRRRGPARPAARKAPWGRRRPG